MLDLTLGWAVVFFPTALAVAFIFVPSRSEDESAHMRWRVCLVVFGIVFSLLAWLQQARALRAASNDRESAIKETSARVATETADRVTKAMAAQYEGTISGLNQQIGALQSGLSAMDKASIDRADRIAAGIGDALKMQTGGDSFTYLGTAGISENGAQIVLLSQGRYPLYGLGVRVTDVKVLDATKNFMESNVFERAVGDMGSPRAMQLGFIPFRQPGEIQNLNVFFSGRNGFWTQLWRWRKVNGQWAYESIVSGTLDQKRFPKGAVLKRDVTKGFPEEKLLTDQDWQNVEKLPRAY